MGPFFKFGLVTIATSVVGLPVGLLSKFGVSDGSDRITFSKENLLVDLEALIEKHADAKIQVACGNHKFCELFATSEKRKAKRSKGGEGGGGAKSETAPGFLGSRESLCGNRAPSLRWTLFTISFVCLGERMWEETDESKISFLDVGVT